uniref:DNA polymerase epsilon catalytic subunit n=1 Tax=Megaselia scalaris TaxID=36166 RepID=T1GHV1_MEGSC
MNWTIAENLPTDNGCQDKFEHILTQYMESLSNKQSPAQAIKQIAHTAYDFVLNLNKGFAKGKEGPAIQLIRTLIKVLSVNKNFADEINDFRRNMLRFVGIGEFSDLAEWKDNCDTYILNEVICKACNHCRDLDLCKDKHRAMKDGVPIWICSQCYVSYDNEEIENKMIDIALRKIMTYNLQDLKCVRCKEIKRENLSLYCPCSGQFESLIQASDIESMLKTFLNVAENHKMNLLQEISGNTLLRNIILNELEVFCSS